MQGGVIAGVALVAGGGYGEPNCDPHSPYAVSVHVLERIQGAQNRKQQHHGALVHQSTKHAHLHAWRWIHRAYVSYILMLWYICVRIC